MLPMLLKLPLAVLACLTLGIALLFAGPATSGALLLPLPAFVQATSHDLPASYEPLHKGHVDLSEGFYVRNNEDLIVRGTPPLVLRRVYISRFRESKQFGIGAMHTGERYLVGDPERFQWVALIRPGEARIRFERTSPGASLFNAMYEHRGSTEEWDGAQVGWLGFNWVLRKRDGSLIVFQPCGPGTGYEFCSIIRERDADGHFIYYHRTRQGRLSRIVTDDGRSISFEYDHRDRIVRAVGSTGQEVSYEYDARGRLSRLAASRGRVHRYRYTDHDEMTGISEPGTEIENVYVDGRCVRQVNRYPDREPYIFDFKYEIRGDSIVQTESIRSDGTWLRYVFNDKRYTTSETWGRGDTALASFTYERDPVTNGITALTLTCPDRHGIPLRHTSLVRYGNEESIKEDLVSRHCFRPRARSRGAAKASWIR